MAVGCRSRQDPYAAVKPPVPVSTNLRVGSETQVLSTCGLCHAGCGIRVRVVEGRAVKVEGNPDSPVNRGRLCARGQASLEVLYHPDRVRGPMRRAGPRGENRWQPLAWDEAIASLTDELSKLRADGQPQSVVLIDGEESGTTHVLWARFLRAFGSPNHIGHGATGTGATARTLREMAGTTALPGYDFEGARMVLLVGTGALESSPQSMHLARALARGSRPRLLCAWPRLPSSAALVDEWLPLAPGGQSAFLLGLSHVLMREELADESALEGARGFAPYSDAEGNVWPGLRSRIMTAYAPDRLEARTGIPPHGIEGLARELAAARPSLVAVDETTSDDATAAAGLVLNALLGNLDAPGGMILGGDPGLAELGRFVPDAAAERGLRAGAIDGRRPGRSEFESSRILAVPEAILAGKPYPAKALLLSYSNPAYSKPRRERWKEAIARVPLVVSFSPLMDESALFADMVLPDLGFFERWDVVVPGRGSRALSLRQPVVRPLGNAMQTGEVIVRLARALGGAVAQAFPWHDFREAVRAGLVDLAGGTGEVLTALASGGAWLAPPAEAAPVEREPAGAGRLGALRDVSCVLPAGWTQPEPAFVGDPEMFPWVLVPFRGPGYGEGGMRHMPWLCELPAAAGDPWRQRIEISPADARALGVEDGDRVVVESPSAAVAMWARVHEGIRPGVLGLPMGGGTWPDAGAQADASSLLASLADEATGHWMACATRARLRKGT